MTSILVTHAFVSLVEVKAQLGITDTSEDTKLEFLINSATDLIERYCGRRFKQTEYTDELYDGEDSNRIIVKNAPISAVLADAPEVSIDDVAVEIESISYTRGVIEIASIAKAALANVKVSYKGGYAAADTPWDLKQAAVMLVANFRNSDKAQGIASESVGDYSVSYKNGESIETIPASVKAILINYKNF